MIAVREEVLENNFKEVKKVLEIINNITRDFKKTAAISKTLSKRYDQDEDDILQWLKITEWNAGKPITERLITNMQNKMIAFNVIKEKKKSKEFIKNMYF